MKGKAYVFPAWAALAACPAFIPAPAEAHCPTEVPEVEMAFPAPGTAVQNACYKGYGTCILDTFHVDTLRRELVEKYRAHKYAVFAYADSVESYLTMDTVFYQGRVYYVDTFQTEKVHLSIHTVLKDSLPVRKLTFIDRWIAIPGNPFATTYSTLVDTPFVAFFDAYGAIKDLGIGPLDGCFFEPTVYALSGGRIHKKGQVGDRMPGISLAAGDFFAAIGRDPVEVPAVGLRRPPPLRRSTGPFPGAGHRFDLNGRRIHTRNGRGRVYSFPDLPGRASTRSGTDGPAEPE